MLQSPDQWKTAVVDFVMSEKERAEHRAAKPQRRGRPVSRVNVTGQSVHGGEDMRDLAGGPEIDG